MGLNDRDYARYDQQPGFHLGGPQSATVQIIVATVAVYIAQLVILSSPDGASWTPIGISDRGRLTRFSPTAFSTPRDHAATLLTSS